MKDQIIKNISASEANILIKENNNIVIIDVRSPEEFNSGHIENSINIDIYNPDFAVKINELSKEKPYLVYCHGGNRSKTAIIQTMKPGGFNEIYNLDGGITEWESKGYEILK